MVAFHYKISYFLSVNKYVLAPQIHLQKDGQVHLYSRNCEDRTQSFPDVADATRAAAAGAHGPPKP